MKKLETIRDNFIKMKGGKLISVESFILAIIVFVVMITSVGFSMMVSLIIAFTIGFIFPIIVNIFDTFAWIVTILFSSMWAYLGFIITKALLGDSIFFGMLLGIILFITSFNIHKNYSGLSIYRMSQKGDNKIRTIDTSNYIHKETVQFCPKCGRRITSSLGKCDICDN